MILRSLSTLWTSYASQMADHLWQSTLFVVLAAILVLALRKNQGRVRYWVWVTASMKFLLPFSLLIALGSHLAKPRVSTPAQADVYSAVEDFSQPFAGPELPLISQAPAPASRFHLLPPIIVAAWLGGIVVVLLVWAAGWIRVSLMVRRAVPLREGPEVEALRRLESSFGIRRPIRLVLSQNWMEPGIFGVFRPVLIWPEGISRHLDDRHVEAILAHEICHARRHDNLTAILHMLVEAVFWFHPLVWWMGARLKEERERACDEEVSLLCSQPHVYAESILRVCKFCSESPLACVSGITGADLKKRIVQIMTERVARKLDLRRKLLLAAAAVCVVAAPIMMGQAKAAQRTMLAAVEAAPAPLRAMAHAMIPEIETPATDLIAEAQVASKPDPTADPCATTGGAEFDVISIRPSKARSGDWDSEGSADGVSLSGTVKSMIQEAFGLRDFQITGGPDWIASDTFDIKAKFEVPDIGEGRAAQQAIALRWAQRYRSLLQERFQFQCHMTTKTLPVYDLVVAKGGTKLKQTKASGDTDSIQGHGDAHKTHVVATGVPAEHIAAMLVRDAGRTVVDKTGLSGRYDFTLNFSTQRQDEQNARDGEASLPDLLTAVEEQLGLKLVPSKGPVPVLVIDHAEKPTVDGAEVTPTPTPSPLGDQGSPPGSVVAKLGRAIMTQKLSDTGGVDFSSYIQRIQSDVGRNGAPLAPSNASRLSKSGVVAIRLALLPDGRIGAMKLEQSSGNADLDKAAWYAITSEGTFPPLPSAFHGPQVELLLKFFYNTDVVEPSASAVPVAMAQVNSVSPATVTSAPSFEVASIRMVDASTAEKLHRDASMSPYPTTHFLLHNVPLDFLIGVAYGIDEAYIQNDAGWMDSQLYDVDARVGGDKPLNEEEMRPLLQDLLAQRFHLTVHRTSKVVSGFELVTARGGPKLNRAKDGEETHAQVLPNRLDAQSVPIKMLASILMRPAGQPVVDKTGLTGSYDVRLNYAAPNDTNSALPSLFTAIEEQLGLRLQPAKVPVDFLLIDHADRVPTEN